MFRKRHIAAAFALLTTLLVAAPTAASPARTAHMSGGEQAVLHRMNVVRAQHGLGALRFAR
jgi:uncharacterized protein YkwD